MRNPAGGRGGRGGGRGGRGGGGGGGGVGKSKGKNGRGDKRLEVIQFDEKNRRQDTFAFFLFGILTCVT